MTRDEAIKILKELAGYEKTMDLIQNYSVSVQDALYMAIKALEQETVTEFADRCRECGARYGRLLNQKWIPVSERLPEKSTWVLVTCKNPDGYIFLDIKLINRYTELWDGDEDFIGTVLAWMPLPEPYKEEESEDGCI